MADGSFSGQYQRYKLQGNGVLEAKGVQMGLNIEGIDFHIEASHFDEALELQGLATHKNLASTYVGGGLLHDALRSYFCIKRFQDRWDPLTLIKFASRREERLITTLS